MADRKVQNTTDPALRLPHRPRVVLLLPVLAALGSIVTLALLYTGAVSNDFAQTASVARNLLDGEFLRTDLIYYDVHYRLGPPLVVQTVFPPGYSLLLAPLVGAGIPAATAGLVACLAAFLVAGLLVCASVRRLTGNVVLSALLAAAWFGFGLNWANVLAVRSEMLLSAAALAAIYAWIRWDDTGRVGIAWPLAGGAAAAAVILFRYQGIFFLASLAAVFVLGLAMRARGFRPVTGLAFLGPPGAAVAALFGLNLAVTGTLVGGPFDAATSDAGATDVALALYYAVCELLGVSREGLLQGNPTELLLLVLLGLTVVLAVVAVRRPTAPGAGPVRLQRGGALVCVAFIGMTVAAIAYLAFSKSLGYVQARYLTTVLGPLLVLSGVFVQRLADRLAGREGLLLGWGVLAAAFLASGQIDVIKEQLEDMRADRRLPAIANALAQPTDHGTVRELLVREAREGRYVLANDSQLLGFELGIPTFGLPPAEFTETNFSPEEVSRLMETHGIRWLLVVPALFDSDAPWNRNRQIFREILEKTVPRWLETAHRSESVLVYRRR